MTDSRLHNPLTPALSPVSGGEGVNLLWLQATPSRPDGKGNLSPRPACGERARGCAGISVGMPTACATAVQCSGQRALQGRGDRAAKLSRNYVTLIVTVACPLCARCREPFSP